MKKRLLSLIIVSVCLTVLFCMQDFASAAADELYDAYKAYYDFLKNETDNVGLPITDPADASPNYPYVNVWYTGKLLWAKLIDFDNNGIPELYYGKEVTDNDHTTDESYNLYTYTNGQMVKIASGDDIFPEYEFPSNVEEDIKFSIRITTDADGRSYYLWESYRGGTTLHSAVYTSFVDGVWTDVERMHIYFDPDIYISQDVMTSTGERHFFLGASSGYGLDGGYEVSGEEYNARQAFLSANGDVEMPLEPQSVTETMNFLASFLPANYVNPSDWALQVVNDGIAKGIVPKNLQKKYCEPITRAEFCALAASFIENATGESITERAQFNDTQDENVQKMGGLGVVSGVGGGNFAPYNLLTREEAAVILSNLAEKALLNPLPAHTPTFADNANVSSWALNQVGQMQASGIMGGVGDNLFAPADSYTREQSIATIMRMEPYFVPVTSISLTPKESEIRATTSTFINVEIFPANATNKIITEWKSSNPDVAEVYASGGVSGVSEGTAVITATTANGVSASCTITVIPETYLEISGDFPVVLNCLYFEDLGYSNEPIDTMPEDDEPYVIGKIKVTGVEHRVKSDSYYKYSDPDKDNKFFVVTGELEELNEDYKYKFIPYLKWIIKDENGEIVDSALTQILDYMTEEGDAFSLEIETDKVSFGESYTIEFVNDEGLDASDITAREPEIRLSGFPLEVSSDAGVTVVEDIRVEYEYDIDDKIYEADIYICGTTEIKSYMGPKFSWELTDEDGNVIAGATAYATTTDIVDKDTGEFCIDPSGANRTRNIDLEPGKTYKFTVTEED